MAITFSFNNSSRNYLRVKKSNHTDIAKKKIEFIEVPGRTGDLIIDDGSRENLTLNIDCYVDARDGTSFKKIADDLDRWLNAPRGYKDLIFSDGTRLKAVFVGQISFESLLRNFKEIRLVFSAYRSDES